MWAVIAARDLSWPVRAFGVLRCGVALAVTGYLAYGSWFGLKMWNAERKARSSPLKLCAKQRFRGGRPCIAAARDEPSRTTD